MPVATMVEPVGLGEFESVFVVPVWEADGYEFLDRYCGVSLSDNGSVAAIGFPDKEENILPLNRRSFTHRVKDGVLWRLEGHKHWPVRDVRSVIGDAVMMKGNRIHSIIALENG